MMQNNCKIIGLTGGIATGKSTVAKLLKEKGYKIIDADKIAKGVVEIGKPAYSKIVEEFGNEVLLEDNTINRKALGKIIFNDKRAREKLNYISHPYIFEEIRLNLQELCKDENTVVLDIPLLFEQFDLWEKYGIEFDEIVLVDTDEDTQIKRLIKRDNISRDEAVKKIRAQLPMDEKRTRSSKIINNSGDMKNLKQQIEKLLLS